MTTTTGTRTETRCLDCRAPCSQSITCRLHIDAPLQKAARLVADVLYRSGFEVAHRLSLSRLAEERLGVETEEVEVLFLRHPLLLLQYLFTGGGDPALLFPFMAILRAQGRSTHLCLCSAWSTGGIPSSAFSRQMVKPWEEKLIQAAAHLGDSEVVVASKDVGSWSGGVLPVLKAE
jgi:hypothetical protein